MILSKTDWISLVEESYNLNGSDKEWLGRLVEHVTPLIPCGTKPIAWTHHHTPTTATIGEFASQGSPLKNGWTRIGHALADQKLYDMVYRNGRCVGTACMDVFPLLPGERPKFRMITGGRFRDMLLVGGHTGTGHSVVFATYSKEQFQTKKIAIKRWRQIGPHLGAGLRLRNLGGYLNTDTNGVEAVLDPDGKIQDASAPASSTSSRDALRSAVRFLDKARTRNGRAHVDESLDNWQALVDGRWSLVDKFDTDGRRYVVAVKNEPNYRDPRGLTLRERQVSEYVGMGYSSKQIAYTLGVSSSVVTDCTARAQKKLGLSSRPELAAFFAQNGLRAKLAEVAIRDDKLLVGAYPLVAADRVASLTEAELDVVISLLSGSTNADIAQRRRSSERTVANQVQAIYRKIGVRSRSELAVCLQTER